MTVYRMDSLFRPRSLALVGASPTPMTVGRVILDKLRLAGFSGRVDLVNPKHHAIDGRPCVASLSALSEAPDLVIVASPPATVAGVIDEAIGLGARSALVLTAGLRHGPGSPADQIATAAHRAGLRVLGPNCVGLIVPSVGLDASFAATIARPGDLAVISQSGAIAVSLVEWARARDIGFSAVVSLGDMIDVDFGDCLDYFAADAATRAIVLYVEAVTEARKFMSAARAAARAKPVVVLKAGRHEAAARAASTHTGALAGSDIVYDAAFRRVGVVRVRDLDELFSAAEILGRRPPYRGPRLAILTNGGGIGVLAVDRLADLGGVAATLSQATVDTLNHGLPPTWSRANPVDIIGDADAARYQTAFDALIADPAVDAIAILHVPTAIAQSAMTARGLANEVRAHRATVAPQKPVLAAWLGATNEVAALLDAAAIPHFETEADAIEGFTALVRYHEGQRILTQTPPQEIDAFRGDLECGKAIVDSALRDGRKWLSPIEAIDLLAAYSIPVVPATVAPDAQATKNAARPILAAGQPVALKILSPDIIHKSDVNGVRLDLVTEAAVEAAAAEILAAASEARPDARIAGLLVQPMVRRPKARELIAGIADDPVFGPVIIFGSGGTAVEVIKDIAAALPPLDASLARDLVDRPRVSRVLDAYRNVPAADRRAVEHTLLRLAQLAADLPTVRAIDINPLLADADGVLAIDARITIAPVGGVRSDGIHPRFAIRPYPRAWERKLMTASGQVYAARPLRPEDEGRVHLLFSQASPQDLRMRFHGSVDAFDHNFLARLVQLDYARAMAFAAIDRDEIVGVVSLHSTGDGQRGEFAIIVRTDRQGRGLGHALMALMLEWARAEGVATVNGSVLRSNHGMLALARSLGFAQRADPDDPSSVVVSLSLLLQEPAAGSSVAR